MILAKFCSILEVCSLVLPKLPWNLSTYRMANQKQQLQKLGEGENREADPEAELATDVRGKVDELWREKNNNDYDNKFQLTPRINGVCADAAVLWGSRTHWQGEGGEGGAGEGRGRESWRKAFWCNDTCKNLVPGFTVIQHLTAKFSIRQKVIVVTRLVTIVLSGPGKKIILQLSGGIFAWSVTGSHFINNLLI